MRGTITNRVSLGELERQGQVKLFRGKVISATDISQTPGTYPIYSSSVTNNGLFGRYGKYALDEELITWSVDGGGDFFHRPRHQFSVTNVCGYIRVISAEISIRFLAYQLQALHSMQHFDYTLKAHPSVIRSLYKLDFPPVAQQRDIAAKLSDSDELILALKRLIAKKQAIKQGMMQQLLTGKTRLPGFTKPWNAVRLGDHVRYLRTVALSRAQLDTESALRYLHYGDIHTSDRVRLDAASSNMPRVSSILAGSAECLEVGDLVFADASEDPDGVGRSIEVTSIPEGGLVAGLHTIAARFDKGVLADGFKAYLQFIPDFRTALLRLAAGTKVLATTRTYVSSIDLLLPDTGEQRAISHVLSDADGAIDALRTRLVKAKAIKQGLMQELLTGRTRLPVSGTASGAAS